MREFIPYKFDRIDKLKVIVTAKGNWESLCKDIKEEKFAPYNVDLALSNIFLKTFNELFDKCEELVKLTKKMEIVCSEYRIMRGTKISIDEYNDTVTYGRLLPQKEYIKEDNRFSPRGVEWLYLAISNDLSQAKECCIKECRAKKSDKFALASFEISNQHYNNKIVDLTVGVEYDYTELENRLKNATLKNSEKVEWQAWSGITQKEKQMRKSKQEKYRKKRISKVIRRNSPDTEKYVMEFFILVYCKLISENIFEPIETDKQEKYAPFHCLAQYFIRKGYGGIIYSSTVYKGGKNLVLFDKKYATPFGDIDKFEV
jgi:RES domain.